ncbi:hypothetical protein ABGB17_27745, partial [Sphaerisporangium sp. B11E5]
PDYGSAPAPDYGSAPDYRVPPDYGTSGYGPGHGPTPGHGPGHGPAGGHGSPPGYAAPEYPPAAEYGGPRYPDSAVPRENMIVNDALPYEAPRPADPSYPPRVPPQAAVDPADPLGLGAMAPPSDSTDPQLSRPYVHEPMYSTGERVRPEDQPRHADDRAYHRDRSRDW